MHAAASSLAFTDYTARPKTLTLDGLTLIGGSGSPGYTVPIESVKLVEAGPGQVSSLVFTIVDPLGLISVRDGARVELTDQARGSAILFAGWVASWSSTPLGIGRSITLECVGIESVLDWLYVPTTITYLGTDPIVPLQAAIAQAVGIGVPLNAAATGASSDVATPIGTGGNVMNGSSMSWGPGTLRAVLTSILDSIGRQRNDQASMQLTVDFYGGIRVWQLTGSSLSTPDVNNLAGLTISAAGALIIRPDNLQHRNLPGEAIRSVYVKGASAAGSGTVTDGSGVVGPSASINVPNSATQDDVRAFGLAYLQRHGRVVQGTVTAAETGFVDIGQGWAAAGGGAEVHAFSPVLLTDAQVGVSSLSVQMQQIEKRFWPSGMETWTITYGSTRSAAQYLRQLTRAVNE